MKVSKILWNRKNSYLPIVKWGESICENKIVDIFKNIKTVLVVKFIIQKEYEIFNLFFFLEKMSQIFDSEIIKKEFEEFYQVIIPNLNNCNGYGILKCSKCFVFQYDCVMCCIFRCKNCQLFKTSRDILFQKTSIEQYNYIVNFVRDLYHVSEHSIMRYIILLKVFKNVFVLLF